MRFRDRLDAGRHLAEALARTDFRSLVAVPPCHGVVCPLASRSPSARSPSRCARRQKARRPLPARAGHGRDRGGRRACRERGRASVGRSRVATELEAAERRERPELEHRAAMYREGRARADVAAAVPSWWTTASPLVRPRAPHAMCRARSAPLASSSRCPSRRGWPCPTSASECDELVCLSAPDPFFAVGEWYRDFSQTRDDEVIGLLRRSLSISRRRTGRGGPAGLRGRKRGGPIPAGETALAGRLTVPPAQWRRPLCSRQRKQSPQPAQSIRRRGPAASGTGDVAARPSVPRRSEGPSTIFDVPLFAARLEEASKWATSQPELDAVPLGYFGASTGAAAGALGGRASRALSWRPWCPAGGRPDLAGASSCRP